MNSDNRQGLVPLRAATSWLVRHKNLIILTVIVLLAFAVRFIDVTDNPRGFFTDEAAAGLDAQSIWKTGRDMHGNFLPFFFQNLGDYKLPIFIYAEVPFVAVLGLSELTVRLTVVVMGTLTVATTYLLASELFHRGKHGFLAALPALVSAGILTILPWHIHYSRTGFGELVSFPLVFTVAWYIFLRAQRTNGSLIPAAFILGLCFYTYRSSWVVLPPFVVLLVAVYWRDLMRQRWDAIRAMAILAMTLLPLAHHLLFGPGDRASDTSIFRIESEASVPSLFVNQYLSYFSSSFLLSNGDNGFFLRHYLPDQGVLYWFMLPLIVAGAVQALKQRNRQMFLLVALVLLYPLGGALSDSSPISSRTILGAVVFALLAGLGVQAFVDAVGYLRPRLVLSGAVCIAVAITMAGAISLAGYLNRYFDEYPAVASGFRGWQDGPEEIIGRFVQLQDNYDELYLSDDFTAPGVFIPFYAGGNCSNCFIGGSEHYDGSKRQLFVFRAESPELERLNLRILDVVLYPDGTPAFFMGEVVSEH